ncbi:uncharacterized protein K02A2.6-like [Wyeomyia smithii]|uniref:uncharacterized protein K02A2.6-like n=1 Tax=Wyeomyia smithii TaxID=174621 RepID=UPI002467D2DA|nr:uncharacterized protein K02A2.6-like [Wyeomyia smithii]
MVQSLSFLSDVVNELSFDSETEEIIRAVQQAVAIDIEEVAAATVSDQELQKVIKAIETDKWDQEDLKQYRPFRLEFSNINNLVMRGTKLVIPISLRSRMCELAHEGHPGQSMMKRRLRERCWWPGIDQTAVKICERCEGCQLVQSSNPPEPMTRRALPEKPWVDIAMDFLGPMPSGEYLLVVIDYYSRYIEIEIMTRITAQDTIKRLKRIFRTWGPPRTITLDNAKQFISTEFKEYCSTYRIHLNHTSPYWPQANGEVERQNRSLLKRMKIAHAIHDDWKAELDNFLDLYNNTPHTITGKAPSELLQGRKLRSKIPQIEDLETVPPTTDFRDQDTTKKLMQKERENARRRSKLSNIFTDDIVLMKNLLPLNKLSTNFSNEKFTVVDKNGSNVTIQSNESGKQYDRNVSHLKKWNMSSDTETEQSTREIDDAVSEGQESSETNPSGTSLYPDVVADIIPGQEPPRRSLRNSRPTVRYSPSR